MKRIFINGLLISALLVNASAPFTAFAQFPSPSSYPTPTFPTSSTHTENGPSWTDEERYWRGGNGVRTAVEQLPAERVEQVPLPILFGVTRTNITPDFGDPRSGGRTHEGQDILAPRNALIISPTAAVVLSTGVWSGAGNYVSTANPGGETFVYMHLEKFANIKAGDILKPGDLIGYVGNTGNAAGGPTHLHFEIRKNGPTDPYPRLTGVFTPVEKIQFATAILEKSSDRPLMAQFLATTYTAELRGDQATGVVLPTDIATLLLTQPANGTGSTIVPLPGNDLALGSHGPAVIKLQEFLIAQNKGPSAMALAAAGATGNFGTITRTALMEYQAAVRITPADGYYGPLTQAYVEHAPSSTTPTGSPTVSPSTTPPTPPIPLPSSAVPNRDLTLGSRGADVIWLQAYLIARHAGIASEALAEAGTTGYFGNVTRVALAEYQRITGISPAVGYFGTLTRAYILKLVTPS